MSELRTTAIDPASAPEASGGYAQGVAVDGAQRLLFISGQIPVDRAGDTPDGFEAQARLVWANLLATLDEAGLAVENLVKVTTFLASREYAGANSAVRREVLGAHRPALTVVLAGIFDEAWLLEVEAIAAG